MNRALAEPYDLDGDGGKSVVTSFDREAVELV